MLLNENIGHRMQMTQCGGQNVRELLAVRPSMIWLCPHCSALTTLSPVVWTMRREGEGGGGGGRGRGRSRTAEILCKSGMLQKGHGHPAELNQIHVRVDPCREREEEEDHLILHNFLHADTEAGQFTAGKLPMVSDACFPIFWVGPEEGGGGGGAFPKYMHSSLGLT